MLIPTLCLAFVLPKAEVCVRNHVQPYISSILEALMTPTSQGFAEVREVFFKEVTDMNMNIVNEGGLEKLAEVRPCWLVGLGVAGPALLPSSVRSVLGDPRLRKYRGLKLVRGGMSQPCVHGEAVLPR